jgi:hypothetical protein
MSEDNSVSEVTGYKLDGQSSIPSRRSRIFFHIQIGSETHPVFYLMGIVDSFPRGKAAGEKLNIHLHLHLSKMCEVLSPCPNLHLRERA